MTTKYMQDQDVGTRDSLHDSMRTDGAHNIKTQVRKAEQQAERIPTNVYIGGVAASIAASAALMMMGKKNASIFVGLWPPTILNLAMVYKNLRPSNELRNN